jgi:glycine cleavage system H protein
MEIDGCVVPDDLRYDLENDIWFRWRSPGEEGEIGLTASLASFAGRILSVSFRPVTGTIAQGRSLGTIESVRYTGPVRVPVDAKVLEVNEELIRRPKWINDSPYERGWFARILPLDPPLVDQALETAAAIRDRWAKKIRDLHIRCYPAAPDMELYEIGAECSAVLAALDDELAKHPPDDVVLLVTDDPTSPIEFERWSDRTGHSVLHHHAEGTLHHFLVRKEADPHPRRRGPSGPLSA